MNSVKLGNKTFSNPSELITFVEDEILQGRAFAEEDIEILDKSHSIILQELFEFTGIDRINGKINKIVYGPHMTSGGIYGSFRLHILQSHQPENADNESWKVVADDKDGKVFAVPSRRVVTEQSVSYIDAVNRLFMEYAFRSEQGYIRNVNGSFFPSYLAVVERLLRRYPLRLPDFLESVTNSFPHHRSEKMTLVCSARNLLSLAIIIPALEVPSVQFLVGLLSRLDCEGISSSNQEKLDEIMENFIQFINFRLDIDTDKTIAHKEYFQVAVLEGIKTVAARNGKAILHSAAQKEKFIYTLLATFDEQVIKMEKPRVVHFVYYYISSLDGDLYWVKEAFLERLVLNLLDKKLQRQAKLHSLLYLFSYLRTSTTTSGLIIHTALCHLLLYLQENFGKFMKRNPQICERKLTFEEIKAEKAKRLYSTENTSPIGDDIFLFCYQSCLDLFSQKKSKLTNEQKDDIGSKMDELIQETIIFVSYSLTESETFFFLFKSVQESLEDFNSKQILVDLLGTTPAPLGLRSSGPTPQKKSPGRANRKLRDMDYLPFRPLQMRFYDHFISPILSTKGLTESIIDRQASPFDSSISIQETSNTDNGKVGSPLGKRSHTKMTWPDNYGTPQKKLST